MLTEYNLTARVRGDLCDDNIDRWFDALEEHHLSASAFDDQHCELTITLHATSLVDAAERGGRALVEAAGDLESLEVVTTAEFDRRWGLDSD